jgi:hypothetical protein
VARVQAAQVAGAKAEVARAAVEVVAMLKKHLSHQ